MQENGTAHSLIFKGSGFEYAKIYFDQNGIVTRIERPAVAQ